jgi:3-hydroxyisobutyrate dehydrogenase-like beta-hydroxyacid dehydrogenase
MSDVTSETKTYDVAVIGCGLMGATIARTLVKRGYSVAAWNRTPERAEALAGDGVTPMRSVIETVRSSRLVIACTLTHETTLSALGPVDDWSGATLVDVTSGTPEEAEAMQLWALERGADYLDGAVLCYPQDIGLPETMLVFAGPSAVWSEHEQTLMSLGGASRHVSEQVRTANVLMLGFASFFIPALGAYVEAATYAHRQGLSAAAMRETSLFFVELLKRTTEEAATAIESGDHTTEEATIATFAEGTRSALGGMRRVGVRARLLAAALESLEAAEAAGLGDLGFYAQGVTAVQLSD